MEHMKDAHGFTEAGSASHTSSLDESDGDIEDVEVETASAVTAAAAAATTTPKTEEEDEEDLQSAADPFDPVKDDFDVSTTMHHILNFLLILVAWHIVPE